MSNLYFDGFDGYDSVADTYNYGGWNGTYTSFDSMQSVTPSGTGKSCYFSGNNLALHFTTGSQSTKTLYVGANFRIVNTTGSGTMVYFQNIDGSSTSYSQCHLYFDHTVRKLYAYRGAYGGTSGTLIASGTTVLSFDTFYSIEVRFLAHSTTGIFDVKINGASEFTFSGNTQSAANDEVLAVVFGSRASFNPVMYIDNTYINNSDGSFNNTYLGDVRAEILTPNSDSSVAWTPTGEASNYLTVDDAIGAPDDDTTYVSSSTSTAKDQYGLPSMSSSTAVHAVKVVTRAEKDDANPLSFKHGITNGANVQTATYALGVGYTNYIDIFETKDGGTTAWDETAVNAAVSTVEVV